MSQLQTILIEDEQDSRAILHAYLSKYCKNIDVIAECANIQEGEQAILAHQPDLIFLDIEMPFGNGFDLLERFEKPNFEVIFVTAYSNYAIQAFNMSAAHYLLKPIDIEELIEAVSRVTQRCARAQSFDHTRVLLDNLAQKQQPNQKVVLPLLDGFKVARLDTILYCEADTNFTCFHFKDGSKELICRNLKHYATILETQGFCRVHRSYLVNLDCVKQYIKGKGGTIILENNQQIQVSNNRKAAFLERFR